MDPEHLEPGLSRSRRCWRRIRAWWLDAYDQSGLLRHLVHEPLFLAAALLVLIAGLGVALLIPKQWDPAPPGFSRSIRISLLDYLQAWALRRSGAQAVQAGRWDDALASYRGAVGNNLADPTSLRGTLGVLRDAPWARSANLGILFTCSELLLEVTATNRSDALLVADVLERHRIAELALEKLRPWSNQLTPEEDAVWTRSLLGSGRIDAFLERWKQNPTRYQTNPTLQLYRAAVDAGWGSPATAVPALDSLHQALSHPPTRATAARLLAAAALQREDLNSYSNALHVLHESDSAMALDDTAWWELLARNNRREEAQSLAKSYARLPPPTALEMVQLARSWLALGLEDHAIDTLKRFADRYGQSLEVWTTYLDLLMLRKDWNEVRRISATLRANSTTRDPLLPVTLYADVRADLAEGRKTSVREGIRRLLETPLPNPNLALRFAAGFDAANQHDASWHYLRQLENTFTNSTEFWFQMVVCARGRQDVDTLRRSADRLATLAPNNLAAQSIRLVTLLGTRENPSEALALSFKLANARNTDSPAARINHATALLLNHRADEARRILDAINPASLGKDTANSWLLAQTDALAQTGQPAQALIHGRKVDPSSLLPPHRTWFSQLLADCESKAKTAPSIPPP